MSSLISICIVGYYSGQCYSIVVGLTVLLHESLRRDVSVGAQYLSEAGRGNFPVFLVISSRRIRSSL